MTTNGDDLAFPIHPESPISNGGLTKREFFASQILAGIAGKEGRTDGSSVKDAVRLADVLIQTLNELPQ
ncbi:MAG: hypothetical protein HEQ35_10795 [Gloeotrichia echinulata IR180]|jgi:hypothetical protein